MDHSTLEILQYLLEDSLNPRLIRYITPVRLELLPQKFLAELFRNLFCVRRGSVEHRDVSACGSDGSGYSEADATVPACDDVVL